MTHTFLTSQPSGACWLLPERYASTHFLDLELDDTPIDPTASRCEEVAISSWWGPKSPNICYKFMPEIATRVLRDATSTAHGMPKGRFGVRKGEKKTPSGVHRREASAAVVHVESPVTPHTDATGRGSNHRPGLGYAGRPGPHRAHLRCNVDRLSTERTSRSSFITSRRQEPVLKDLSGSL